MPSGYLPIFIFLAIAIAFPTVTIIAAKLIRPSAPSITKLEAYECGIKAASDSRGRYTVRFYIIAILFVIFGGIATAIFSALDAVNNVPILASSTAFYVFGLAALIQTVEQ